MQCRLEPVTPKNLPVVHHQKVSNNLSKLSSTYFSFIPSLPSFISPSLPSLLFLISFTFLLTQPLPFAPSFFIPFLLSLRQKLLFCRPSCLRTHYMGSHSVAKLSSNSWMTLLVQPPAHMVAGVNHTPSFKLRQQQQQQTLIRIAN